MITRRELAGYYVSSYGHLMSDDVGVLEYDKAKSIAVRFRQYSRRRSRPLT